MRAEHRGGDQHRQAIQIACLEEIAHLHSWIGADQARAQGEALKKTVYGRAILPAVDGH